MAGGMGGHLECSERKTWMSNRVLSQTRPKFAVKGAKEPINTSITIVSKGRGRKTPGPKANLHGSRLRVLVATIRGMLKCSPPWT